VSWFPDVEKLVTQFVRNYDGLLAGVDVGTSWEGFQAGQTRVVLTRAGGGTAARHRIDRARIDVEVVAPTKGQAQSAMATTRTILAAAPGFVDPGVAVIVQTVEESGPAYIEDPVSDLPRYVAAWLVDVRPDP
jgi:hypothetical protein